MAARLAGALDPRRRPVVIFAMGAAGIVLASRAVVGSAAFSARPDPLAIAVTLDLTLSLSLLFWLTVVRARAAPPATTVAVFLGGVALASALLPPAHRAAPSLLGLFAVPAEIALGGWLAWSAARIVRTMRGAGESVPFEDALRLAGRNVLGPYRSVEALLAEASFLWFALCSWRKVRHVPPGTLPFSVHLRSDVGSVLVALALAGVAETLALHLLVAHWSTRGAWALTALSAYSALWLVGDWRALVLRPILVTDREIVVRIGLRWRASIPLDAVEGTCAGPDPIRHRPCAVASPLGRPNLYLHLRSPAELQGPLGLRRRGACVGLRVDEPDTLRRLIDDRSRSLRSGG